MKKNKPVKKGRKPDEPVALCARRIRTSMRLRPSVAVILGSGLGAISGLLSNPHIIETSELPHYPSPTVVGHRGRIVIGKCGRVPAAIFQGRIHFYETGSLEPVLFPIRLLHALGIRTLVITNAAGGLNESFHPADLMIITDQINATFRNPLLGRPIRVRHRPQYDPGLVRIMSETARERGIDVRQGIYCGLLGPSYETAAEVEMARRMGSDAVGMSTVNEVSLAVSFGMRVAGISCITNLSTGISEEKLSHDEVTQAAARATESLSRLLAGFLNNIGPGRGTPA